jgi:CRP-like cAMP-binding protein
VIGIPEFFASVREHQLLQGFESRYLEKLVGLARAADFPTDAVIFRQGEKTAQFYLITQGSVVLEVAAKGASFIVQTLYAGDAMGWSAVTGMGGANFDARAIAPVRTIAFDGAQLRAACESDPSFGYVMMKALLSLVSERLDATRIQIGNR